MRKRDNSNPRNTQPPEESSFKKKKKKKERIMPKHLS